MLKNTIYIKTNIYNIYHIYLYSKSKGEGVLSNLSNCKTLKREYDYVVKLEFKSMERMCKKAERLHS